MDKGWNEFLKVCLASHTDKSLSALFELFLTSEERDDLVLRFLIVKELLKGEKTQRQIAKELNVSIAKITRGSNELKRMNRKLIEHLKIILFI